MKHSFVPRLMFALAGLIIVILLVALISLQYNNAFAEGVATPTAEVEDDCMPSEYWDHLTALYGALYEVPEEWAEAFAQYLDHVGPLDTELVSHSIATINLGLDGSDAELYWVVECDGNGNMYYCSIADSESGPRLVWPVVDPEIFGEEFSKIVSGMKPGEIWEFTAHEEGCLFKYLVLATPDVANIRELKLKLDLDE